MDQILLKKCTFLKTLKKEINEIKNGGTVWTSEEKTFRHEKY